MNHENPQQPDLGPAVRAWIGLHELPEQNVFQQRLGRPDEYTPQRAQYTAEITAATSEGATEDQIRTAALELVTREAQQAHAAIEYLLANDGNGNIFTKAQDNSDAIREHRSTVDRARRLGVPMDIISGQAPTSRAE